MDKTIDLSVSNLAATRSLHYDIALLPWGATEPLSLIHISEPTRH